MGKNQGVTNRRPIRDGITAAPAGAAPGLPAPPANPWLSGTAVAVTAVVLAVAASVTGLFVVGKWAGESGGAAPPAKGGAGKKPITSMEEFWDKVERDVRRRPKWKPKPWVPASADDRVVDQFVGMLSKGDPKASALLGPAPKFPKEAVSEAKADALQTDFLLRADKLRVETVLRGEPDSVGGLKPTPGRYTLRTKWTGEVPGVPVRTAEGVEPAATRMVHNLDLIVDVRGGKLHGVRAGLHDWPW